MWVIVNRGTINTFQFTHQPHLAGCEVARANFVFFPEFLSPFATAKTFRVEAAASKHGARPLIEATNCGCTPVAQRSSLATRIRDATFSERVACLW